MSAYSIYYKRSTSPLGFFDVVGQTFKYRGVFRSLGGRWIPGNKAWRFRDSEFTKVENFVSGIGKVSSGGVEGGGKGGGSGVKITTMGAPKGRFFVVGKTYKYKQKFKDLGGKWDFINKAWSFNNEVVLDVEDIIAETKETKETQTQTQTQTTYTYDFSFLFEMFRSAGKTLKNPRIRILVGRDEYILKMATVNALIITDAKNRHMGTIIKSRLTTPVPGLFEALRSLEKYTFVTLASYGTFTGRCPFCYKCLTKQQSLEYGYGPVCARTYGLEPPY